MVPRFQWFQHGRSQHGNKRTHKSGKTSDARCIRSQDRRGGDFHDVERIRSPKTRVERRTRLDGQQCGVRASIEHRPLLQRATHERGAIGEKTTSGIIAWLAATGANGKKLLMLARTRGRIVACLLAISPILLGHGEENDEPYRTTTSRNRRQRRIPLRDLQKGWRRTIGSAAIHGWERYSIGNGGKAGCGLGAEFELRAESGEVKHGRIPTR